MEMTRNQHTMFEQGREFAAQFPGYCFENAVSYLSIDNLEAVCSQDGKFFEAGFDGRKPEWVTAIRYGEIPESGHSTNWATGDSEGGVSCLKIIRKESDYNLGHPLYELQGVKKIVVEGWYFGDCGSDGEPLILFARKKGDCNNVA